MKTIRNLTLSALLILIYACNKPVKEASIQVDLPPSQSEELEVYALEQDLIFEFDENKEKSSFVLDESAFFTIPAKPKNGYIFIKPGEQVKVGHINKQPPIFGATGEISKENEFLNRYLIKFTEHTSKPPFQFFAHEPDSFRVLIKNFNKPLQAFYDELEQSNLDEYFKEAMLKRIQVDLWELIVPYPRFYSYGHGGLPKLPADFFTEFEKIDFNQPIHLAFKENLKLAKDWTVRDIHYPSFETPAAYNAAIAQRLDSVFDVPLLNNYYEYLDVIQEVNHGAGLDASADKIAAFEESNQSTVLKKLLQKNNAPWELLKAGAKAPDFIAETRDGNKVTLDSLLGKKLYVDIWATWCAPCLAQIPALKQLEKELEDEDITFVSISIDSQKDKEKWAKFVENRELGGVQLYTEGEWNSDLAANYNITGIPRFFIIDENGNFINANAPNPSHPMIKEILMN